MGWDGLVRMGWDKREESPLDSSGKERKTDAKTGVVHSFTTSYLTCTTTKEEEEAINVTCAAAPLVAQTKQTHERKKERKKENECTKLRQSGTHPIATLLICKQYFFFPNASRRYVGVML